MDEKKLIQTLEEFFSKAPHLPAKWREVLVKIAPWLVLIFGILGVLGGLAALGVSPVATFGGVNYGTKLLIAGVFTLVSSVLMLMAFPGLKARKYQGWRLFFWSEVVSVVASIISLDLVGAVLGFLIGFYILFEIKSHYK